LLFILFYFIVLSHGREQGTKDLSVEKRFIKEKAVAMIILIAARDWPDKWPTFLEQLVTIAGQGVRHPSFPARVRVRWRVCDDVCACMCVCGHVVWCGECALTPVAVCHDMSRTPSWS
jgi:hypothetical protein